MNSQNVNTIWKFPIPIEDRFTVEMPLGARVLSVDVQRGVPCIWAVVDPGAVRARQKFALVGTGHPMAWELNMWSNFVGTFQLVDLGLVFHLFTLGSTEVVQ